MTENSEKISNVTIMILYDNNHYLKGLETAWGFSCLVKNTDKTILFDTGGDGSLLLRNMKALRIDPAKLDLIFLSHMHSDHIGGFWEVIKENHKTSVYIPGSFPESFKEEAGKHGLILFEVIQPLRLSAGVFSTGELGFEIIEQSMIVQAERGPIVITGCAHPGILTIVSRVKDILREDIFLLVGGFHLCEMKSNEVKSIVADLKKAGVRHIGPCHCSGDVARELFEKKCGTRFLNMGVGKSILTKDLT
jgi:7,8-dihydropterin-6-yl-methyl-4-(beta-D-ribofuranosyl)aminobenzene 5'-phosphate synthase